MRGIAFLWSSRAFFSTLFFFFSLPLLPPPPPPPPPPPLPFGPAPSPRSEYIFDFDRPFEVHDDVEILKHMGLTLGIEDGSCTPEQLAEAKKLVPSALESYLDEIVAEARQARGGSGAAAAAPATSTAGAAAAAADA